MINTFYFGKIDFQWWEYFVIPLLFFLGYFIATRVKSRNIKEYPEYKYLVRGFLFKAICGLGFGVIYVFYYKGGDTINYYQSTLPLMNVMSSDFGDFLQIYMHNTDSQEVLYNVFDQDTGFPLYFIFSDSRTFMVCKLTLPFMLFGFKSYFATTLLISMITYIPLWKLYRVFVRYFPSLSKELAIAILFIPSVLFWGGGIAKDSFTFAATCLAVAAFSDVLLNWRRVINYFWLLLALFVILTIKPYILNIMLPSFGAWIIASSMVTIRSTLVRFVVLPIVFVVGLGGAFFVLRSIGASMDKFSLDKALETAVITQQDLKNEELYGSNSFDIGDFDPSMAGVASKFPVATIAGLFRPFIWEARSPVMLLSGLENLLFLVLLILSVFRIRIRKLFRVIIRNPILVYCIVFSVLFAFMIGLTTSNFGALVRFKIPMIPFFAAFLLVIYSSRNMDLENQQ